MTTPKKKMTTLKQYVKSLSNETDVRNLKSRSKGRKPKIHRETFKVMIDRCPSQKLCFKLRHTRNAIIDTHRQLKQLFGDPTRQPDNTTNMQFYSDRALTKMK